MCGSHIVFVSAGPERSVSPAARGPECVPPLLIPSRVPAHTLPPVLLGETGSVSEGVLNKPQQRQNVSPLAVITPLTNKE